jgi:hypothetical protein
MEKYRSVMCNRTLKDKDSKLHRFLYWFIKPGSRGPLALVLVVTVIAMLSPLILYIGQVAFYQLSWRARHWLGQSIFFLLCASGMIRLWRVLPRDSWFETTADSIHGRQADQRRLVLFLLRILVGSLLIPLLANPHGLGFADWDFFLEKYEAVRRTILNWGQFPWWDPWCRGGYPLAADPQVGVVSPATPLVLLLGTSMGLRVAALLFIWASVEGAFRLGWLWLREAWAAAATALVYSLNGAVLVDTAWGFFIPMSYCVVPWLFYCSLQIGTSRWYGVGLGCLIAATVLIGAQYVSFYGIVLAGLVWLRSLRVQKPGERLIVLSNTGTAIGLFLLLTGWRLVPMLLVMNNDQRGAQTVWNESLGSTLGHLLNRPPSAWVSMIPPQHLASYIEMTSYVGMLVLVLSLLDLLHGWRWWHALALLCGWLAIGSAEWYQPSYWLADWPLFRSTHVVTRWRFIALLGIGLAAGSQIGRWRCSSSKFLRRAAIAATIALAADFSILAYQQLPLAFSVKPDSRLFPEPPASSIVNVRAGMGFPCILRGYGVIEGYQPMLGYRRDAPSLRRARQDPLYQGEAWSEQGAVEPAYWSPNHLVFQATPFQDVNINQNPGSWWVINGQVRYAQLRCAEMSIPFTATADAKGRIDLQIHPKGLYPGIGLQALGGVVMAVSYLVGKTAKREESR